jgi:hypothetical protein
VLVATGDVEIVQIIHGHSCADHSKPYLSVDQFAIRTHARERLVADLSTSSSTVPKF